MNKPVRVPEQPQEHLPDRPKDQPAKAEEEPPRAENSREQEVVRERTNVIETTRRALEELTKKLPQNEGRRQERFVA